MRGRRKKAEANEESQGEGQERETEPKEDYEKEVSRFKMRKQISMLYSKSIGWV